MAKLVAARKGKGVHNGQDKRNDWRTQKLATFPTTKYKKEGQLTDKREPQQLEPHNRQDGHENPPDGLDVQRQPEEPAVGGIDDLGAGLAALKHPLGLASGRVDLVPPTQADEAAPGNVFQVVKVGGEEEDGDDEDHDPVLRISLCCTLVEAVARR